MRWLVTQPIFFFRLVSWRRGCLSLFLKSTVSKTLKIHSHEITSTFRITTMLIFRAFTDKWYDELAFRHVWIFRNRWSRKLLIRVSYRDYVFVSFKVAVTALINLPRHARAPFLPLCIPRPRVSPHADPRPSFPRHLSVTSCSSHATPCWSVYVCNACQFIRMHELQSCCFCISNEKDQRPIKRIHVAIQTYTCVDYFVYLINRHSK